MRSPVSDENTSASTSAASSVVCHNAGVSGAHMLTSATKKVDRGVATFTRLAHFSKLPRQVDRLYNIKNGGVGIGNVSRKVPVADIAKLNAVKRRIAKGELTVKETVKF